MAELLHPLDNPGWGALSAGAHAGMAVRVGPGLRYPAEVSPFAAAPEASEATLAALGEAMAVGSGVGLALPWPVRAPAGLEAAAVMAVDQMVAEGFTPDAEAVEGFATLGAADAEEMAALTALTEPGPWRARTYEMGRYIGVRDAGALVAMAGERMKPPGFSEVSAVCTHPDHRGKGLAGRLTAAVAGAIAARGETPFLHVFPDNAGAISIYRRLGFVKRRDMFVTVLVRRG
jgi:ribosomal protein S18 acetylase RimI-like enzyme